MTTAGGHAALITPDLVLLGATADDRDTAIRVAASRLSRAGRLTDEHAYVQAVLEREAATSTAVGFGIATPHAKTDAVARTSIAVLRLSTAVRWSGEDDVDLVVQLAVTEADRSDEHLRILAALARRLVHADFRAQLRGTPTAQGVVDLLDGI
ncbi:PTS sugar transporter subunit IIA [Xylanimonas allomyrinae]|uniref:PTS sugar transporter subunit IIA n=1 Tax=Xylanimonas allomyrinae TaxID=2509459 RepID=UPI0013A60864|nr:PTS sugar transporter subunit IIA [Xylanimonas allomyrinae]